MLPTVSLSTFICGSLIGGFFPGASLCRMHWRDRCLLSKNWRTESRTCFLSCGSWSLFIFFSLASAKLNTYILPVYPAAALLIAKLWKDALCNAAEIDRGSWYPFIALIAILISASIALCYYLPFLLVHRPGSSGRHCHFLLLLFLFKKKGLSFCNPCCNVGHYFSSC